MIQKTVFKDLGEEKWASSFLQLTKTNVATLLPIMRGKVDVVDGCRVTRFHASLTDKIQAAIDTYDST